MVIVDLFIYFILSLLYYILLIIDTKHAFELKDTFIYFVKCLSGGRDKKLIFTFINNYKICLFNFAHKL